MSKKINSYKDCMDDKKVLSFARHNGVDVRECKGSHFRMEYKGEYETGVHGEMSCGVAKKVYNFFVRVGLISITCLVIGWIIAAIM